MTNPEDIAATARRLVTFVRLAATMADAEKIATDVLMAFGRDAAAEENKLAARVCYESARDARRDGDEVAAVFAEQLARRIQGRMER